MVDHDYPQATERGAERWLITPSKAPLCQRAVDVEIRKVKWRKQTVFGCIQDPVNSAWAPKPALCFVDVLGAPCTISIQHRFRDKCWGQAKSEKAKKQKKKNIMMDYCPSACFVFEPFRACGLCGLVHPLYRVRVPLALGRSNMGGWSLESISLRRHQLMARDDPVLSPVCPSPFASAFDEVCALSVEVKVRLLQCVGDYSGERRQPL